MDWARSFQRSIDYIEDNLTEPLDIGDIARRMNLSPFYYQKLFTIICGFPAGEYIRNRRLALAGSELARSDARVIDIALKYGYDTPEGFTRAFVKFHGVSPSAAKKGAPIRSFARLSVTVSMKGGSVMDYKIVKKEAFRVLEKKISCSVNGNSNVEIPKFWDKCRADGTVERLLELTSDRTDIFGICYAHTQEKAQTFDYSIAAKIDDSAEIPEGFTANVIPARTWIVFECRGAMPDAIQRLWHRICTEFFPSSELEPTYEMDVEAYKDGDMTSPDYRSEIWVPVAVDS
ncbi:MAG: AraC family transcriptional regulator [Lachnospiraceae bacterium]|nr:AraC family transcriptional regulator [Ruminococcus sp.]MCM1275399.1 AraC family transcriptional regulator [Lachnospiraceae bacterium]